MPVDAKSWSSFDWTYPMQGDVLKTSNGVHTTGRRDGPLRLGSVASCLGPLSSLTLDSIRPALRFATF